MEEFRAWLYLTNTVQTWERKNQAGFGVIFWRSDVEWYKNQACNFSLIELCLSEGIS